MFESMQTLVPTEWQGTFNVLTAPVAWIPAWHVQMVNVAWYGDSTTQVFFKRLLLMLPTLLIVAAMWCTMLSLYTIPFRSHRGRFATAMMLAWWDTGRMIWLFWAGMVRLVVVLAGWTWGLIRLAVRLIGAGIKGTFRSPLMLLDWTSRNYFKPGVPWVAFLALIVWCAVEAVIFMFTLSPTLSEVLTGITGYEPNPSLLSGLLWLFLFFLILGSFACIEVLNQAVRSKRVGEIIQMTLVELSVMFFEVIFLYRELVDAITPWIAQQTNEGVRLGLVSTLALACFGWIGVRGMTWFLFGRFGTPALLAVLARDTIRKEAMEPATPSAPQPDLLRGPIAALKEEAAWFRERGEEIFSLLTLPVLQLFAAAVNFVLVLVTSRPMFELPFQSLKQALAVTPPWRRVDDEKTVPSFEAAQPGGLR